jgi:hypothetical protein
VRGIVDDVLCTHLMLTTAATTAVAVTCETLLLTSRQRGGPLSSKGSMLNRETQQHVYSVLSKPLYAMQCWHGKYRQHSRQLLRAKSML